MCAEEKNQKHQTNTKSERMKVINATKNAVKSQCLEKKGERRMLKNRKAADRRNAILEKNYVKGNTRERKA
uniref:Uncharacterized protein n=1 Tax=Romanomermis culicivorax TaxID=13658 RepID=A0A915LBR5_ROMCU